MTDRTRKTILNVPGVLGEAGVGEEIVEIVTFGAKSIRTRARVRVASRIQNRIRQQIQNSTPRTRRRCDLAEFISPLQNMRILGTVRAIRSIPTKFAVVVTVVTVRAENARPHRSPLRLTVQVPYELEQAGLRQLAVAILHHRMSRSREIIEL